MILMGVLLAGDLCHGIKCKCRLVMNDTTEPCTTNADCNNGELYEHRCTQTMDDNPGLYTWYNLGAQNKKGTGGKCDKKKKKCVYPIGMAIIFCGEYNTYNVGWFKKSTPEGPIIYGTKKAKLLGKGHIDILVKNKQTTT
jgi:hypothetical protein